VAVAELVGRSPQHREEPSAVERRVLAEKASGLSDLEVAAKLMLSQQAVRAIVCRHGREPSTGSLLRHSLEISNHLAKMNGVLHQG
jgi:hypothetical protein